LLRLTVRVSAAAWFSGASTRAPCSWRPPCGTSTNSFDDTKGAELLRGVFNAIVLDHHGPTQRPGVARVILQLPRITQQDDVAGRVVLADD